MKIFRDYIGILRIYSLVDLMLLLVVIHASLPQFIGAVVLHIAFLAYLESRHSHEYRTKVPAWLAYLLAIIGLAFFAKVEGLLYVVFSYLYTKKTKDTGTLSPFFRGLQSFAIVAGVVGYVSPMLVIATLVMFLRNLAGDFRDTEKDRKEEVRTIPVVMGVKKSYRNIHLFATIISSIVWWSLSTLGPVWIFTIVLVQILTYNLTPRGEKKEGVSAIVTA